MRSLSVFIFAFVLATGIASQDGNGSNYKMRELVNASLTYIQKICAASDPAMMNDISELPIIVPPIGVFFSATNRSLSGFADTTVTRKEVTNNTAQVTVSVPVIVSWGIYKAEGFYKGRRVFGEGFGIVYLVNATVDASVIVSYGNNNSLHIDGFLMIPSIGGVYSYFSGLSVDGLSEEEVMELTNELITKMYLSNLPAESLSSSLGLQKAINQALVGRTIDDAINWLKENTPQQSHLLSMIPELKYL